MPQLVVSLFLLLLKTIHGMLHLLIQFLPL